MFGYVYVTENTINGKLYVGKKRSDHFVEGYLGSGKIILRAVRKYGKDSFHKTVLQWCETEEELNEAEVYFIWLLKNSEFESYNITNGGEGFRGKHRPDTIEKFSKQRKGRPRSEEAKKSTSETLKGVPKTEQHSKRISEGMKKLFTDKSNHPWTGRKHRPETLSKMKKINKGKIHPKVTCPHCNKTGGSNAMKRYHFDNCLLLISSSTR